MPGPDESLPEILRLNPRFWVYDPIPPWLLNILDKTALKELAVIQIEAQRAAIQLQAQTLEKTMSIVRGIK
jgi:hypothetical protein